MTPDSWAADGVLVGSGVAVEITAVTAGCDGWVDSGADGWAALAGADVG